jgi:UDP-glucose 4-epimerase
MQKTILVVGGAGYIGSHTAYYLAQHHYRVIILDNFVHQQPFDHQWATIIRGDYGDCDLLHAIFSNHPIDAVMHFAAYTSVGESVKNPAAYYENNVSKTITLFNSMLEHAVSTVIFSSSAAVYGIPYQSPISEDHPKNPINPYGHTKLIIEQLLDNYATAYGFRFVALRYFNAAGALDEHGLGEYHRPETHIIPLALEAAITHNPFFLFGTAYPTPDGTCIRDYVHVADIANAHMLALNYLNNNGISTSFNLGNGSGYSVKEILNQVRTVTKNTPTVVEKPARPGDPAMLIADATKAKKILRWQPCYSDLPTIIQSAYQSHVYMHSHIKEKEKDERIF